MYLYIYIYIGIHKTYLNIVELKMKKNVWELLPVHLQFIINDAFIYISSIHLT